MGSISNRLGPTIYGRSSRGFLALALLLTLALCFAAPAYAFPNIVDFNIEVENPGTGPVCVADLDGDGWNDILVVDDQGNVSAHIQYSSNELFPFNQTSAIDSSPAMGMALGYIDSDSRMDLVSYSSDSMLLNLQYTSGQFIKFELPLPFTPNAIDLGDLDGDEGLDVVLVGDSDVLVLYRQLGRPGLYNLTDSFHTNQTGGDDIAITDLGGTRGSDIVVSSPTELDIFIQGTDGLTLEKTIALNGSFTTSSVSFGDFNTDFLEDVVVLRSDNGTNEVLEVYAQEGDGNFTQIRSVENEDFDDHFAVGDLNDDGLDDMAIVSDSGNYGILLYLQKPTTRSEFTYFQLGNLSADGGRIALGELNGDPYLDIVLRVQDRTYVFYQDDFPPFSANHIPSRIYFNENTVGDDLIKLDDYLKDDHNKLQYYVISESDPDLLHVVVDGVYLDFYPKQDWSGAAKFQVGGRVDDYELISNKFIVRVNDVPDILSEPITRTDIGENYYYKVEVEDTYPLDDRVTFDLSWGPEGMEINPFNGEITWIPKKNGEFKVSVVVRDRYGGEVEQSFVLQVGEREELPMGVMVFGISSFSILLVLAAVIGWNENAKFAFFLLFVPLYTKLKRENILDHFVRGKIYGYVLANPGEHYNAIREALDLTNGSLAHHLRTLERENFIKSKRFGIYRRFYPYDMKIPDEFMMNEIQKTIVHLIERNPGISQKEIATEINLTPPTVNYHIGILSGEGLIHVARNGRKTECFLNV